MQRKLESVYRYFDPSDTVRRVLQTRWIARNGIVARASDRSPQWRGSSIQLGKMRKKIKDEFTDLPVSRQRKYQLRMHRAGCCMICGKKAISSRCCLDHLKTRRERARKPGSRRNYGALSYRLDKGRQTAWKTWRKRPRQRQNRFPRVGLLRSSGQRRSTRPAQFYGDCRYGPTWQNALERYWLPDGKWCRPMLLAKPAHIYELRPRKRLSCTGGITVGNFGSDMYA